MKVGIVGGGLAGTTLALQMVNKGINVVLLDKGINFSSRIAAGMINPLVFRRMTKSWRLDDFTAYFQTFYKETEEKTAGSFFHPIPIRRFFSAQQEKDFWIKRQNQPEFASYMTPLTDEDETYFPEANILGSGLVKQSYYVNTNQFLQMTKEYLSNTIDYRVEAFDFSQYDAEKCIYKAEAFDKMIFCEGFEGKENPHFSYLPLNQTKGETLTIELKTVPENESLNRKCFILPLGNQQFKVGSTYVWNTNTTDITEEGKQTILENLSFLTKETPIIVAQNAGVRPTTMDRRPLMGEHPTLKNNYIFNGLGTKGYMMAPLLSKEMAEFVIDGTPLDKEVNIERFKPE